ncbi:MFS transporter [Bhargavaea beijingensis]|uniref:MFS transporter n=1 Tax=Bhargavaea beijingensis TaxID=426756 RepID=A0A1G7B109_9BACL|nr:MFS transporter [Bhargavaea beijingensis]MCW1928297.1 MFS transporter [Bhargavaea beijingensis]RSK29677.1 MFS transporter [Bhargavaea beijingensis]SDE20798.1 MFS transporter, DHA1 family, multidrug resistance protein [Bhargavaea beijingensis]
MKKNIMLTTVLINLFIAFMGIGLVIPVLPALINELGLSGSAAANLVAAFALTQLLVSPVAGKWTDKYGRKRMIVIGLMLFSLSELLFGLAQSISLLFASRLLGGVSAAFIMPAVTAFIADITTIEERPKALGYMSAAISTGFIVGPGFGGFLAEIGTRIPFFAAFGLAFVAAMFSLFALREPHRQETGAEEMVPGATGIRKIFAPVFFIAFIIIFILSFGLASFESLFALYTDHKYGFTPKDIAIMVTGGGIIGAVAQIFLFDRLNKWLGEIRLIRWCLIVSAVLVYCVTLVSSYFMILLVTMTVFVGFDLVRPAVTTYLSKVAGNEQGFAGGMNSMFTSLGNVFGPVIGGILFDIQLDYPFYFATATLAVGVILSYVWKKPKLHAAGPS